jgi:hypothetical protein
MLKKNGRIDYDKLRKERLDCSKRRELPSISNMLRDISIAMQNRPLKLLDVVALLVDKPAEKLVTGQVGTVVELLAPDVYEVEFLDSKGRTIGVAELKRADLLLLQHEPVMAA